MPPGSNHLNVDRTGLTPLTPAPFPSRDLTGYGRARLRMSLFDPPKLRLGSEGASSSLENETARPFTPPRPPVEPDDPTFNPNPGQTTQERDPDPHLRACLGRGTARAEDPGTLGIGPSFGDRSPGPARRDRRRNRGTSQNGPYPASCALSTPHKPMPTHE